MRNKLASVVRYSISLFVFIFVITILGTKSFALTCSNAFQDSERLPILVPSQIAVSGIELTSWPLTGHVVDSVLRQVVQPFPSFSSWMGYFRNEESGQAFFSPIKSADLNKLIAKYNSAVELKMQIPIQFTSEQQGLISSTQYFDDWALGKLPASQSHDFLIHVLAVTALPRDLVNKSIRNFKKIKDLLDQEVFQHHPKFVYRLKERLGDKIDAVYYYDPNLSLPDRYKEWAGFVVTPKIFMEVVQTVIGHDRQNQTRYFELEQSFQTVKDQLEDLSEQEFSELQKVMHRKLKGERS